MKTTGAGLHMCGHGASNQPVRTSAVALTTWLGTFLMSQRLSILLSSPTPSSKT